MQVASIAQQEDKQSLNKDRGSNPSIAYCFNYIVYICSNNKIILKGCLLPNLLGKDIAFYSDRDNIDKWLLISLVCAADKYPEIPFNKLHEYLGYYLETFIYTGGEILTHIESSTYNCNTKTEYKIENRFINLISKTPINNIPDWDDVFTSDFRGGN